MAVDKGYAWIVMVANFGAMVVNNGLLLTTGIVLVTLHERFQEDVMKTALVTSLYTSLSSLAGPLGSFIIHKASCRVAVVIGSLLMTSGFIITAFSQNLNGCIFSYGILAGLGSSITYSVLFTINGFHFKNKLNIANGVSFSGAGVGLFALAPLLEMSQDIYGYQGVFMVSASASLQLLVFGGLMRPSRLELDAKLVKKGEHSDQTWKGDKRISQVLCDKATLLLIISFGFFLGGKDTAFMYWPSLLKETLFTPSQTSLFLSISGISAIIGRLFIGCLSSRACVDVFYLYCFSLVASGILCINYKFYASSVVGQIMNAVLIGTFSGVPLVVFAAITIKCVGVKYLSSVGGLQLLSGGIGTIATPLICGFVVSKGLKYADALMICGSCLLISAVFIIITRFTKKRLVETDNLSSLRKLSLLQADYWGKNCL